jgi:flagellar hook-associated protein 2
MTTTAATSSIVTALGGGSGIDTAALANSLAEAQFSTRSARLTTKSETLDRQISAASTIKSMLLSLTTSLGERVRSGDLSPQPQIANGTVAKVALSGGATPSGSYALEVTALAKAQALASPAYAAPASPVGAGSLTLRFGTIAGAAFTEDTAHAAVDVTIPSGATLADVASAINGKAAGVTAYVANTSEGAKLVLKGKDGAAQGFVVEATETPGEEGLAALAWEPSTGAFARLVTGASDAAFKIDNLAMTATSNTVNNAIPGLNLTLSATNTGTPTLITFADPGSSVSSAMQDLTAALNEIAGTVSTATHAQGGDLARDSGALALRRSLSMLAGSIIMPSATAGAPRTLADLGLSTQRDGTFVLDDKRLAATLKSDSRGAAAMFTNGLFGVFATIDSMVRKTNSAGNPGSLAGSIARYSAQKTAVSTDQTKIAEDQEKLRAQLSSRFATSESRVGSSKATLSFLQNQIAAWNKSGN